MLRNVEDKPGMGQWPIMCLLLAPARTEDPGGLTNGTGDLQAESFVIITIAVDALDADVRAQMNGVPYAPISASQCNLQRHLAVGEEDAGEASPSVREGQLGRARYHLRNLADRSSKFVSDLHRVRLRTQLRW
jgi:hypothetical protein